MRGERKPVRAGPPRVFAPDIYAFLMGPLVIRPESMAGQFQPSTARAYFRALRGADDSVGLGTAARRPQAQGRQIARAAAGLRSARCSSEPCSTSDGRVDASADARLPAGVGECKRSLVLVYR